MLSNQQKVILGFVLLPLVGLFDYVTSFEINTAIFYILPLIVFSYQAAYPLWYSVFFATLASLVWGLVDHATHPYSNDRYLLVNWTTRCFFFLATAMAANRFCKERGQRAIILEQKMSLEKTNEQLNKILGIASHDIRNPVGAIQSMSEILMLDPQLSADSKELVTYINTSAKNSLEILNHTLNLSQIRSGTLVLNRITTDYIAFVKENLLLNEHIAARKQQSLRFETAIISVQLSFDKARMLQIINNLVTNAIKYSEKNKTILVRISWTNETQTEVLTEVIDEGIGIDEKYHEILFDPFVTTSNTTTANESTTGLGLAIVQKLVHMHGGTLQFSSEKGKGSNFSFTLPLIAEQTDLENLT
ncbi:MAG TPA: HAMP domain-containing sensor histidine kinase [Sediminibacterium sp.]